MKTKILAIILILLAIAGFVMVFFFLSKIKLSNPKPINSTPNSPSTKKTTIADEYLTFKENGFEIAYPNWLPVNQENMLEPNLTKVAVTNSGCNFVIAQKPLPEGKTFKAFLTGYLTDQLKKVQGKVSTKEIGDTQAFVEGTFPSYGIELHSYSKSFLVGGNQIYSAAFVSDEKSFSDICLPYVEKVFSSLKIK